MAAYSDAFAALQHIYLEDSWVLGLRPSAQMLAFDIDAVLTENHPEYRGPVPGEQYNYRPGRLVLFGEVSCDLSGAAPASDASGSTDLGHIDTWTVDDAGVSRLTGDWGVAQVRNAKVEFVLT